MTAVWLAVCLALLSACGGMPGPEWAGGEGVAASTLSGAESPSDAALSAHSRGESSHASASAAPRPEVSEPEPSRAEAAASEGQSAIPNSSEPSVAQGSDALDIGDLPPAVAEAMVGGSWTEDSPVALHELTYITVPYLDFEGVERVGEMVVHHSLAGEIEEIFAELYEAAFPIAGMALIDHYNADDFASMEANNSYCYCARRIAGTARWSIHSYGSAIDINPLQNPYCLGESVYPSGAADYLDRSDSRPGMIVEGDVCYTAFVSRGWSWGGHWASPDYQHFQKTV